MKVSKSITITLEQAVFVKEKEIPLSELVQNMIQQMMDEEEK